MDPWGGSQTEPATLHRCFYAGNNPVMMVDPSGEMFSLSSMAISMSIGSTISVSATYISSHAVGRKATTMELVQAGAFGAIAGPLVLAYPTAGVVLGVAGVTSSGWLISKVFNNPDSTYFQKSEAVALFAASMFGTRVGVKYLRASKGSGPVPQYPLNAEIPGISLESTQSGLRADKVWKIPGIMKSMLDGKKSMQ